MEVCPSRVRIRSPGYASCCSCVSLLMDVWADHAFSFVSVAGISYTCMGVSSVVQLCATLEIPWTAARQALLSMGFSRQEYWSGLPCPPPGDLLTRGSSPGLLHWQVDSLPPSHQGRPQLCIYTRPTSSRALGLRGDGRAALLSCAFTSLWAPSRLCVASPSPWLWSH